MVTIPKGQSTTLIAGLGIVPALLELRLPKNLLPCNIERHLLKRNVLVPALSSLYGPGTLNVILAGHIGVGGRIPMLTAPNIALRAALGHTDTRQELELSDNRRYN